MRASKHNLSKVFYVATCISVALAIAFAVKYFRDAEKTSWEYMREEQQNCARVVAEYLKDLYESRLAALRALADGMEDVRLDDAGAVSEYVKTQAGLFEDISLFNSDGKKLCGSLDPESVASSAEFESALAGGEGIARLDEADGMGRRAQCFFMPVRGAGKESVKAVLAASVLEEELGERIDRINAGDAGGDSCSAVIDEDGMVMYAGTEFLKLMEGMGDDYYTYLKRCTILGGPDAASIQEGIEASREVAFKYEYEGGRHMAVSIPLGINDCHVVSMSIGRAATLRLNGISKTGVNLLVIFLADMVLIFVMLFYNVASRDSVRRLLNHYQEFSRQEGAVLFEYTFYPKKKFEVIGDYSALFGKKFKTLIGDAVYDVYDYIHEDDRSSRGRLHSFFDSSDSFFTAELRIKDAAGNFVWYRLAGTMYRDDAGMCKRFIGKLTNANNQISMEKALVQQAENDMLTGVLNKKTFEAKFVELFKQKNENKYYIFYMIDLDNFKNVNDKLGHMYGDKAIADTAKALKKIFHNDAFIGRLGGDEFAVCSIYEAFDEDSLMKFVVKNAEKVCEANRREYSDGVSTVRISSSVGVVIGPRDGANFEILYKRADEAMYNSKNTGKNKYTIFHR